MLRSTTLALACLAFLSSAPAWAEPGKAETAPGLSVSQPTANSAIVSPSKDPASPKILNAARELAGGEKAASESSDANRAAKPDAKAEAPQAAKGVEPSKSDDADTTAEAPKPAPPPEPTLTAKIDLATQKMVVSEAGDAKYTWAISSGTEEHPTPRGTFRPQWTAKMWYSKKYDNAPMPNAVFIHDGVAIHATFATGMLGRPASHGCIRLSPANAATFYKLVNKHGTKMTRVSVFGTPKWQAPQLARRDRNDERPRSYAQREFVQQVPAQAPAKSWFFGLPSFQPASAYNPGYGKPQAYRRPPPPPGYRYADEAPRAYRTSGGQRVYYMQAQPRRVYYSRGY